MGVGPIQSSHHAVQVLVLAGSNFPVMLWCASKGMAASSTPTPPANHEKQCATFLMSSSFAVRVHTF